MQLFLIMNNILLSRLFENDIGIVRKSEYDIIRVLGIYGHII